jgi:hypothetical protein
MRTSRAVLVVLVCLASGCGREGARRTSVSPAPEAARSPAAAPAPTAAPSATPAPTSAPQGTPSAPPGCRNSTAASCGTFRFDPRPVDDQVDVDVTISPSSPKAGDTVTFTLRATDPDSPFVFRGTYEFTQHGPGKVAREDVGSCPRAYGPWDPPVGKRGSLQTTLRHTYREAGTFEATFTFFSSSYRSSDHPWPDRPPGDDDGHCIDPYGSSGKRDVIVRVSA